MTLRHELCTCKPGHLSYPYHLTYTYLPSNYSDYSLLDLLYIIYISDYHITCIGVTATVLQVFFRAGVLGRLEDMRDVQLGIVLTALQSRCRGYLMRKLYRKLVDQR